MRDAAPVLAFDFGAPTASVALAVGGRVIAESQAPRSPETDLLRLVEILLAEAGVGLAELGGVAALAGPGSFTGVRVACAAALALAQARQIPAAGVSSLAALAWCAPTDACTVLAVVDALRGEWFAQPFGPASRLDGTRPELGAAVVWRPGDPPPAAVDLIVGEGAERFAAAALQGSATLSPIGVSGAVARAASTPAWIWRSEPLTRPFYLRSPATTRPRS